MPDNNKSTAQRGKLHRTPDNELRPKAAALHEACLDVEDQVMTYLKKIRLSEKDYIYALKHRTKSTEGIISKVKRKRKGAKKGSENWRYETHHMTDGFGIRIVTIFQSDIIQVVKDIIDIINHKHEENPIRKGRIFEAKIYTNRPKDEENSVHVNVESIINNANLSFENGAYQVQTEGPENKKSGYSSIHIVAYVESTAGSSNSSRNKPKDIAFEIQIRDIFEEAWGEIDHSLRYIARREEEGEENRFVAQWRPHLNALKAFADGCSQHASLIKKNAIDAAKFADEDGNKSMDSADETLPILFDALPAQYHSVLREIYDLRDSAITESNPEEHRSKLLETRTLLENVKAKLTQEQLGRQTEDDRDVEYHLNMEIAFCHNPDDIDEINEAIQIYQQVAEQFRDDTLAAYRCGLLERNNNNLESSLSWLQKAAQRISRDSTVGSRDWIHAAVPRNIGYTNWLIFERDTTNKTSDFEAIDEAIRLSQLAYNRAEELGLEVGERRKALNNQVYFLMRKIITSKTRSTKDTRILAEMCEQLDALLEKHTHTAVYSLDTLWKAYQLLGDEIKAMLKHDQLVESLIIIAQRNAYGQRVSLLNVKRFLPSDTHSIVDDVINSAKLSS
jgi:ppGpp synthetase/RelA/SpoT-type nucleotidyltranferase